LIATVDARCKMQAGGLFCYVMASCAVGMFCDPGEIANNELLALLDMVVIDPRKCSVKQLRYISVVSHL
jgi:hypothetical protein